MAITKYSKLVRFRKYLNAKIAAGELSDSPEQALEEFRDLRYSLAEQAEALVAIQESLAEMNSGSPGRLASEHLAEIRSRYGWTS